MGPSQKSFCDAPPFTLIMKQPCACGIAKLPDTAVRQLGLVFSSRLTSLWDASPFPEDLPEGGTCYFSISS